jgi:predicted transcriptional regulator
MNVAIPSWMVWSAPNLHSGIDVEEIFLRVKKYVRGVPTAGMGDSEARDGPPPFDEPFEGADVEQRVYGALLGTRSPTGVSAIAERAACDPKTARKYLEWFAELGVATRHEGRPVTYERNDAYLEWRRIDRLATEHSLDELQERVTELAERIGAYERRYDTNRPGEVDALAAAEGTDCPIDEVYADLNDWATARVEREHHERARRRLADTTERVHG